jgi:hypothetical protein
LNAPQVKVGADTNRDMSEIEPVTANADLKKLAREAAFMEEFVTIFVHPQAGDNAATHVTLNVNGVNQPVFFGHNTTIKRKYVEVLARMKETGYSQRSANFMNPELSNELIPRSSQVHPFSVIEDKNPKGGAWLAHILSERA